MGNQKMSKNAICSKTCENSSYYNNYTFVYILDTCEELISTYL